MFDYGKSCLLSVFSYSHEYDQVWSKRRLNIDIMALLKIIFSLLIILRVLPKPTKSSLYDKVRHGLGYNGISILNRLLNSSKKVQ